LKEKSFVDVGVVNIFFETTPSE